MFPYASKNGQLIPYDQAGIPLSNIAYQYGFGVYENIRITNRQPYFLADHIQRLLRSAQIISLNHTFSKTSIATHIQELVKNTPENVYNLKIILIGAATAEEVLLFILPSAPLFPDKKLYRHGATLITYTFERLFPQAKTLNMLGSFMAYTQAKKHGAYDALLLDNEGYIREGTRTNFFVLKNKTIFTAPPQTVLEGVTQAKVLEIAKANGWSVELVDIRPEQLGDYEGAFITSTSSKIMPIKKIDNFDFNEIPAELKELVKQFDEFLEVQ